jgi:hypothetical protein
MLEAQFEKYLLDDKQITSKDKAVNTRMSKARTVEKTVGKSLDSIVLDDKLMYDTLIEINKRMRNYNGSYSNALRKYYHFRTGKVFPHLASFERENGL